MKYLLIILLLSSCAVREQAYLIGYQDNKSVLVVDEGNRDTIIWGQCKPGKVGNRYWVYWQSKNRITKIRKIK